MRKRGKFASISRYAPLSSVSWKFTTTVSWLTVAWKRAKFAACREETVYAQYTWSCTSRPRVACSEDKKRPKKSTSADPRQYANTAIKRPLFLLLPPAPFLPPAPSIAASFYLVRRRYKQAHNVDAKMPTDGIPAPSLRRPHALTRPKPLMKPPTMLAFIAFHRFSSVFPDPRDTWARHRV